MNMIFSPGSSHLKVKPRRVACFIAIQLGLAASLPDYAWAREFFNPDLLEVDNTQQGQVDLSAYEEKGGQAPGKYRVDIYVNDDKVDTRDVDFKNIQGADGQQILQACLSVEQLEKYGVKVKLFPGLNVADGCANVSAIPQAKSELRFSTQQLLLTIPQAAVDQSARGYVPPEQWDEGIPALLLNYSFSGSNNYADHRRGGDNQNYYLNLRPGINLGAWRLRNYTTWTHNSGNNDTQSNSRWDTVYTYLQRDITSIKSQLTMGDSSSPSDIFDSVPFRGAQLASDDDMYPDSLKGYAPVVRGIARSNAQVVIRQNGYVIYQSYVAPGAFEITDMYPTGSSGDLDVTIKEADGSEQHLIVPFASLPVLQREGRFKYSITSGQYRSYDHSVDKTAFTQATGIYGLPAGFTLYGGTQAASRYQSLAVGLGKNMGDIGAVSVDLTQGWSHPQSDVKQNGQSWRFRYSKNLVATGTNVAIAGYRYSTSGFYTLQEVLDGYRNGASTPLLERRRNRAEMTINQQLGQDIGSLALSFVSEDYWNTNRRMQSIGVGYNNSWNGISYGLNYTYNRNSTVSTSSSQDTGRGRIYDHDQIVAFNISVPLDRWMPHTYATWNMNSSEKGNTTNSVGLNGTALADDNLSWSVQEGYGSQGAGNTGNASADYRGTYGEVNAGYAYDRDHQQINYGIQGSILGHSEGITLGQPLGETVALVEAPGAPGTSVINQTGVKTDFRGYTTVPYTSPYRKNEIGLDSQTLADNVDLDLSSRTVIPTRGAVVKADFKARVGNRILMTLLQASGAPVPFGSMVSLVGGNDAQGYIVGDDGQVYLTGMPDSGILDVLWGSSNANHCRVNYSVSENSMVNGLIMARNQCL